MATTNFILVLVILSLMLGDDVTGCVINVKNNCNYAVTACSQTQNQNIVQYDMPAGGSETIDTGCSWPAGVVYASVTGECAAPGIPNASSDRNLANLAEFTIGVDGKDNYDLSNVNAYTIGLAIRSTNGACKSPACTINDIESFCKGNNELKEFESGAESCVNVDGTNGIGPTDGTRLFKSACPDAYSYNFDDATSLFTCAAGGDFDVVFCP